MTLIERIVFVNVFIKKKSIFIIKKSGWGRVGSTRERRGRANLKFWEEKQWRVGFGKQFRIAESFKRIG